MLICSLQSSPNLEIRGYFIDSPYVGKHNMGHVLARKSTSVMESHPLLANPNSEATPAAVLGSVRASGSTPAKEGTGVRTCSAEVLGLGRTCTKTP